MWTAGQVRPLPATCPRPASLQPTRGTAGVSGGGGGEALLHKMPLLPGERTPPWVRPPPVSQPWLDGTVLRLGHRGCREDSVFPSLVGPRRLP